MLGLARAVVELLLPRRLAFIHPTARSPERFMVNIRRSPLPHHGTDHDPKPLLSFSEVLSTSMRPFSTDRKSIEVAVRPRKVRPQSARAAISRCTVMTISRNGALS